MKRFLLGLTAFVMAVSLTASLVPNAKAMGLPGISVTVFTPNGGESWRVGSTQTIDWMGVETQGPYTIQIRRHPRQRWQTIATVPENGNYSWRVTGPATKQARIRVYTVEPDGKTYSDISDGPFSIVRR